MKVKVIIIKVEEHEISSEFRNLNYYIDDEKRITLTPSSVTHIYSNIDYLTQEDKNDLLSILGIENITGENK